MAGRRSGSLALALLLLTAGCGGFAPGAGDGGTGLTPAPVPTAGEAYPPGIGASGVVDPQTLARAHERTLENASYRLHSNRSTYFTNGSVRSLHLRYRAFDDGAEYTVDWRVRYRQVRNVTVTEPAWLDRALE